MHLIYRVVVISEHSNAVPIPKFARIPICTFCLTKSFVFDVLKIAGTKTYWTTQIILSHNYQKIDWITHSAPNAWVTLACKFFFLLHWPYSLSLVSSLTLSLTVSQRLFRSITPLTEVAQSFPFFLSHFLSLSLLFLQIIPLFFTFPYLRPSHFRMVSIFHSFASLSYSPSKGGLKHQRFFQIVFSTFLILHKVQTRIFLSNSWLFWAAYPLNYITSVNSCENLQVFVRLLAILGLYASKFAALSFQPS